MGVIFLYLRSRRHFLLEAVLGYWCGVIGYRRVVSTLFCVSACV